MSLLVTPDRIPLHAGYLIDHIHRVQPKRGVADYYFALIVEPRSPPVGFTSMALGLAGNIPSQQNDGVAKSLRLRVLLSIGIIIAKLHEVTR